MKATPYVITKELSPQLQAKKLTYCGRHGITDLAMC